jgi:glycosyltransferase involved in cell wall biosynthesis
MFDFPYEPDYASIHALTPEEIGQVRERFHLANGRRRIVFSGRFVAAKRPDLVIDAFAAIASRRQEWDLVMVGEEDPAVAAPGSMGLRDRVPPALRERVIFTGYISDQNTLSAIYRASDLLCLPSDYEPWALVVNEAAAAGLAIVATDVVGAAAELVREGVNGRLFPPGDLKALTEAMLDVTAPKRIDQMKASSAMVLADWRERGDPVEGLRKALKFARVL